MISGVIKKIRAYDYNHYEMTVATEDDKKEEFIVSRATQVQIHLPARELAVGQKILLTGTLAQKRKEALAAMPDPDDPRTGVPESLRNLLEEEAPPPPAGLPETPELPEEVQEAKEEVAQRDPPNQPSPEEAQQMAEAAGQAPPPGGAGGDGKKEEPQEAVIPKSLSYPVPEPSVLLPATPEDDQDEVVADIVAGIQEMPEGVRIRLAGIRDEAVLVDPEEGVLRIGGLEDLKEGLHIQMKVGENNFVEVMTVGGQSR